LGESADFEVLEDVNVGDALVIVRGGTAIATVTQAQPKRRMARGGKLDVTIDYVRLINDEELALRAVKGDQGGGHTRSELVIQAIILPRRIVRAGTAWMVSPGRTVLSLRLLKHFCLPNQPMET
jgi:hypothetical protein